MRRLWRLAIWPYRLYHWLEDDVEDANDWCLL